MRSKLFWQAYYTILAFGLVGFLSSCSSVIYVKDCELVQSPLYKCKKL